MRCISSRRDRVRRLWLLYGSLAFTTCAFGAVSNRTSSLTGRVFNLDSGQYLYKAEVSIAGTDISTYTEIDGSYRLFDVPAGEARIEVAYTGLGRASALVTVAAGQEARRDFDLSSGTGDQTVQLDAFVVASTREGNAKAIMAQRAALNAKHVVAADNFGESTDGNVGEFLKLVPGIAIEYAQIQARSVRIAGLDPKYAGLTLDGASVPSGASADFGPAARGVELDALSFSNIESVEVNKTLTADMDANAPAGSINLRSKNAFERRGRSISFEASLVGNSYDLSFDKTPGPHDERTRKIRPEWRVNYSDVLLDRKLGIQLTVSDGTRNSPQDLQTVTFSYADANRGPVITNIRFGTDSKLIRSSAAGFNLDYKLGPNLVLSWRSSLSDRRQGGYNRQWRVIASATDVLPESTVTRVVTAPRGTAVRLEEVAGVANYKLNDTLTLSPRFKYETKTFTLSGGVNHARATAEYRDMKDGFFSVARTRISSMSWSAERSGPNTTDWVVRQLSGRPWSDPASFNRDSAQASNITSSERKGINEKTSANLDFSAPLDRFLPVTLKTGVKRQWVDYRIPFGGDQTWTYLGPATSQTVPEARLPTETIYEYEGRMSRAPFAEGWRYPDRRELYNIYTAHPEYFRPNTAANYEASLLGPKFIEERIDAAYVALGSRWRALRMEGGLRYESTRTDAKLLDPIPVPAIRAQRPDLQPGTIPYIDYQYRNGEFSTRRGKYDNFFLSGGGKYALRPDLSAHLAFSQSIMRPDYNNIAGEATIDDANFRVTIPNPELKPEYSTKYYAGIHQYIEPAGTLSLGVFVLDIKNLLESRSNLTQEEAGFGDRHEYDGYEFLSYRNGTGKNRNHGFEIEYSQQLVFLPGALKGISVIGSFTRVIPDKEREGVVGKSASGGIAYRYRRFHGRVNFTWREDYLRTLGAETRNFWDSRTALDVEFSYDLREKLSLFVNGRNVTDAPFIDYDLNRVYGKALYTRVRKFGTFWTLGVKGRF